MIVAVRLSDTLDYLAHKMTGRPLMKRAVAADEMNEVLYCSMRMRDASFSSLILKLGFHCIFMHFTLIKVKFFNLNYNSNQVGKGGGMNFRNFHFCTFEVSLGVDMM